MKRAVLVALGVGMIVSQSTAAGHLYIGNYFVAPYLQVLWDDTVPVVGGSAVNDTSVQIQVWFGEGVVTDDSLLTAGEITTINLAYTYNPYPDISSTDYGPGGYFDRVLQVLPTYDFPDRLRFTFQLRAAGNTPYGSIDETVSRSALWTELNGIRDVGEPVPSPPGEAETVPQLVVAVIPEPTAFALLGLGSLALGIVRRKR